MDTPLSRYREGTGQAPREYRGFFSGARELAAAAGIAASLACGSCVAPEGEPSALDRMFGISPSLSPLEWKWVEVTSEPPGAAAELYLEGWKKVAFLGPTPARRTVSYYSPDDDKKRMAVGVKLNGYYPQLREFVLGGTPDKLNVHFDLAPIATYLLRIETEPPGARIEYLDQLTPGKFDWVLWENSPLERQVTDLEGDGAISVRVSKPGFKGREVNLQLGQERYKIVLEKKEE